MSLPVATLLFASACLCVPGVLPSTAPVHAPAALNRPTMAASAPTGAVTVAAPAEAVSYRPPVPESVADPFRPPATPYGPGNRGLEYDTVPSEVVRAAGAGVVLFAGAVGTALHVVILHGDGIRTSYSRLAVIDVRRGQRVVSGQAVGRAGARFHFGARAGTAYVDPALLFDSQSVPVAAYLVADDETGP